MWKIAPARSHRHRRSSRRQGIFRGMLCLCYALQDIPSNTVLRLMPGKEAAESQQSAARGGNTPPRSGSN
jgi:hypothetical protein